MTTKQGEQSFTNESQNFFLHEKQKKTLLHQPVIYIGNEQFYRAVS